MSNSMGRRRPKKHMSGILHSFSREFIDEKATHDEVMLSHGPALAAFASFVCLISTSAANHEAKIRSLKSAVDRLENSLIEVDEKWFHEIAIMQGFDIIGQDQDGDD